jgi:outer membrane protein assembly factor BamB
VSRAVVLPHEGRLLLAGGLTDGNKTLDSITEIDPQSGSVVERGALSEPVHDAAGAEVGGQVVVFGGGAAKVSATVQGVSATSSGLRTQSIGTLPSPRADLVAASVGSQVVLAGGYDGHTSLSAVVATNDGAKFATVAQLPEPVRYPAAVAQDGKMFLLGGEGPTGDSTAIQAIDPAGHTATVVARLPRGLSHATAVNLGGTTYLLGGRADGHATDTVSAVDLATGAVHPVATLPVAASDMMVGTFGDTAYVLGGEDDKGQPTATVAVARLVDQPAPAATGPAPFDGKLLIADRGNNRLVLVDKDKRVLWTFPSASAAPPPEGFYFPDDAFFAKHGTAIITNEEEQHTIIEIGYPSGQVLASYGHSGQPGSSPGYLNQPDDAYLLADGRVTVADAKNCRILFLNPDFTFQSQIGTKRTCRHDLPSDVGYPNGDTPLANGNVLVSEINGSYVDELTPTGTVVWSIKLPISYPSDPQQLGPDLYLIADYAKPGGIYEFTREGQIVFSYTYAAGDQMLDHPSLTEQLPSGLLCVNDDYRHRVVIIDPHTKQIVWQYGQTDMAGTGPNQLNTPDGFDLLAPDNTTPTHPQTG